MEPMTMSALIGLGGSALSGGMNLFSQNKQQGNQEGALQLAMQDYLLRKRQAEQQYELSTAGQTDSRGNQVRYVPGKGWVTELTPESKSMQSRSDAVQNQGYVESLGRGTDERHGAFNRRLTEGSAASPLLTQMLNGFGAPSREGVGGANKIANVTGASEGADNVRSGYAATALRTGNTGSSPMQNTVAGIDRGATQGIRSALAKGDADEGPLFTQMMDQFNQSKLNPYNMLASRASNVENMPFSPESISGGVDALSATRGKGAGDSVARGMAGFSGAANPMLAAMLGQRAPNYDTFIGGLTDNVKNLFNKNNGQRMYGDMSEAMMNRVLSGGGLSG